MINTLVQQQVPWYYVVVVVMYKAGDKCRSISICGILFGNVPVVGVGINLELVENQYYRYLFKILVSFKVPLSLSLKIPVEICNFHGFRDRKNSLKSSSNLRFIQVYQIKVFKIKQKSKT